MKRGRGRKRERERESKRNTYYIYGEKRDGGNRDQERVARER